MYVHSKEIILNLNLSMERVAVPTTGGGNVLPHNAMGYRTPDGHVVVGWDFDDAVFYLDNGETRTHGEITFALPLMPSSARPVPPIGRYATSTISGDCRVHQYNAAGATVRSSTRTMAVALRTLITISMHDRVRVDDLHVLLDNNTAFVFRDVDTTGGTMGFLDHVMGLLRDLGAHAFGDIKFYERLSHRCMLRPLMVRSCRHITIEARGTFGGTYDTSMTCVSAVMHSAAVDLMDMNPWMAGWPIQRVWAHLGFRSDRVPVSALIRAPWQLSSGVMQLANVAPHTTSARSFAPEALIYGVRSGRITACSGGKYTMGDVEVTCQADMADLMERLDHCRGELLAGDHDMRALVPGCPDALLLEWLGKDYSCATGIYSSH